MQLKCNFTFKHYEEILETAKKKGFKFSFFKKGSGKIIYLRHDIDVSLENSLKIARIEKKHNVRSTFFIRTYTSFYNPISPFSQKIIKKIINLGHSIGLHYDGLITENLEEKIKKEFNYLQNYFSMDKVVSFHRPNQKVFGIEFKNFVNTYGPYFFKECEYISDSNKELKKGCFKEFLKRTNKNKIQILTHPFWWNEKDLNHKQLYQNFLKIKKREITKELKSNIKSYKIFFEKL